MWIIIASPLMMPKKHKMIAHMRMAMMSTTTPRTRMIRAADRARSVTSEYSATMKMRASRTMMTMRGRGRRDEGIEEHSRTLLLSAAVATTTSTNLKQTDQEGGLMAIARSHLAKIVQMAKSAADDVLTVEIGTVTATVMVITAVSALVLALTAL